MIALFKANLSSRAVNVHHLHPTPKLFLVYTGRLIIFRARMGKFKIFENLKKVEMPDKMCVTKQKIYRRLFHKGGTS